MRIDRESARKAFDAYVAAYDISNEKIRLKIEHTYKVMGLCEKIAESLACSQEDIDIAWLCGLLHDVGRFEQLRIYNTFMDSASINHAEFGADILFREGQIREYVPAIAAAALDDGNAQAESVLTLIETAVRYHSAYRLPENLDQRTLQFCNILRDADKIDILRVNVESPLTDIYNTTEEELRNAEVTEAVMDCIREGHTVLKSLKKTTIDNLIGHISFIFELVYPYSRKVMQEQGFLDKLLHFETQNPVTQKQFMEIKDIVYLYEKR